MSRVKAGRATIAAAFAVATGASAQPSAPVPTLEYAFSATIQLAPPLEQGQVDGGRKRFIAITGGKVDGPLLTGEVLAGGGDWQVIQKDGATRIEAHYFLKAQDGTVVEVTNPGVRVAAPAIIERLTKGEDVDPLSYYFRTAPRFSVESGPHDWMSRSIFIGRGIRKPDRVVIDFYVVR